MRAVEGGNSNRKEFLMQVDTPMPGNVNKAPDRKDPSGFVMSMALALFALTLVAVLTMQLAR